MWGLLSLLYFCKGYELFIVPHSHCDPGWIETFDWYYENQVKSILSGIITLLEEDEKRKFVWSEISFLQRWFSDQSEDAKVRFKDFVKKGQIEFVGAGYVQNDEASTDIEMVIRQIEHGHQYLKDEFGIDKVKVGWQIDPFGHSALTPSLFSKFGFEYLVINRINLDFKTQLINEGDLEFMWKGVNLGDEESIFTHLLYDHYTPPDIIDPGNSLENCLITGKGSIIWCAEKLYNLTKERAAAYKTSNLMILYGGDFWYKSIDEGRLFYRRIEMLRDYINSQNYPDFSIKIATPSEYFSAVKQSNAKFSTYDKDFFPYKMYRRFNQPAYWTGYYSTRPALKQAISFTHQLVRAAEIAKSLIKNEQYLGHQASLALHHDSISGTCKPHVAMDFMEKLEDEQAKATYAINEVISSVFTNTSYNYELMLPYRVIIAYNPLNWNKPSLLNIESDSPYVEIQSWISTYIPSQSIENDSGSSKKYTIYFKVTLPALSFTTLFITEYSFHCEFCSSESTLNNNSILQDSVYRIEFDDFGMISNISTYGKPKYQLNQEIWNYNGNDGGAYIFQPADSGKKLNDLSLRKIKIWNGKIVQIAEVVWSRVQMQENHKFYHQKIILYGEKKFIWKCGLFSNTNEEILFRFTSQNISGNEWLLTSNSGDLRSRKYFPVNGPGEKGLNMYPVSGGFAVNIGYEYLKIIPKFSLGVAIANENSFEILMHRNLDQDDDFGLLEGVDDRTFVDYHFEIELGELKHCNFKKLYIEAKTDAYAWWIENNETFKLGHDINNAHQFTGNWTYLTYYLFGFNNPDVYLSSSVIKKGELIFRLWNLKDAFQGISFNNYKLGRRKLLGGYSNLLAQNVWNKSGTEIDFAEMPRSGSTFEFENKSKDIWKGDIVLKPWEFSAFQVRKAEESQIITNDNSTDDNFDEEENEIVSMEKIRAEIMQQNEGRSESELNRTIQKISEEIGIKEKIEINLNTSKNSRKEENDLNWNPDIVEVIKNKLNNSQGTNIKVNPIQGSKNANEMWRNIVVNNIVEKDNSQVGTLQVFEYVIMFCFSSITIISLIWYFKPKKKRPSQLY
ncbi:MAN2A2_9 [Blepharisma stoltei]|uniref:Glycoside hydrolase family 38 central domain-containing protein n=1 Tax=Blepharisma stoltei TaxID=1481888 RepID=A0AAU9JY84_9CILI|nr:unnamed protein product [Blepharisma stoltei]